MHRTPSFLIGGGGFGPGAGAGGLVVGDTRLLLQLGQQVEPLDDPLDQPPHLGKGGVCLLDGVGAGWVQAHSTLLWLVFSD